ncbi:hypothetical protein BV20DRAFT_534063 [Pilatotrama ljubarskyi]|nr:hypothetical protein BV20DRAFT_534063 [Pilatotrama ljubarskyi]
MSQVPWDLLKADTVRAVIKDIGLAQYAGPGTRRTELVNPSGSYARAREESPELEYAAAEPVRQVHVQLHPVVEIPSRLGPSRVHARPRESTSTGTGGSTNASAGAGAPPAKKPRIPPPSYAILHQLEEEISPPSAAPIPLLHPGRAFEGVFLPPPPPRGARAAASVGGGSSQSISQGRQRVNGGSASPVPSRRLEAVVVARPVEAVKLQWKQSSSAGRRTQGV